MNEVNRLKINLLNYIDKCKSNNEDCKFKDITEADIDRYLTIDLATEVIIASKKSFDDKLNEEKSYQYIEESYRKGFEIGYLGSHISFAIKYPEYI